MTKDEALAEQPPCKYPKCNYPCTDLPDCRDAEQPAYRAVKTWHDGNPVYVAEQPAQHCGDCGGFDSECPLVQPAPPRKPWVGLTEQERNDLEDYCEMIIGKAAFEAIEAKLREKNT